MLVHNMLEDEEACIGDIRSQIQEQMDTLSFAGKLWQIFRSNISGTLNELETALGCLVNTIMSAIDERGEMFFVRSLQLKVLSMRLEYE